MVKKPLQLIKRPNLILTKGQKSLYELICQKIPKNQPITYDEARQIYITQAARMVKDGKVLFYNFWGYKDEKGEWHAKYQPLNEEQEKFAVFNWLTNNIGRLVIKGALKIIPQIELT